MSLQSELESLLLDFSTFTHLPLFLYNEKRELLFYTEGESQCETTSFDPISTCTLQLLEREESIIQCDEYWIGKIHRAGFIILSYLPFLFKANHKRETNVERDFKEGLSFLQKIVSRFFEREEELEEEENDRNELASQKALIESERRYRLLVDNTPDLIFSFNRDLHFTAVNRSLASLFQVKEENLIGQSIAALGLPEEMVEKGEEVFQQVMDSGERLSNEITSMMPDGREHTFESFLYPVFDEEEVVTGITGITRDITYKKDIENDLKKKRERLLEAQQLAQMGNWEWDLKEDRVYWSDEVFRIFGYEKRPLEPTMEIFYTHIPLSHRERVKEAIEGAKTKGEYDLEHPIDTSSGHKSWIYSRGEVEFKENKPVRIYGTIQDITERHRGEEALKKKREELDIFFQVVPDLLSITDLKGSFIHINKAWYTILGYKKEDLGELSFFQLIHPDDIEKTERIFESLNSQREIISFVNRLKDKKGLYHYLEWRIFLIHHRIYASARNITSYIKREEDLQRAREKAEEASASKSQFLANMSHEIRTPMNSIMGFAQLALETELTAKQRDYLEKINNSARVLLLIINDILDLSRIEAGKVTLESIDFKLPTILKVVSDMVALEAEKKGLTLYFHTDWDVPIDLVGDPLRLEQILINLINNGVKFTHRGYVEVRIHLKERDSFGVKLSFSIMDTGIGITREQRRHLFKAFSQGDGSTTRKYGGSGLGLIISNFLVKKMGGKMKVVSRPREGSTFSFEALFHLPEKETPLSPPPLLGERVLVIESSKTERILKESLSPFFQEIVFKNIEESPSYLQAALSLELIVIDVEDIESIHTLLSSIEEETAKAQIPILLLIGASTPLDIIEEMREREIYLYTKPFNNLSLYDTLLTIFSKKKIEVEEEALSSIDESHFKGKCILLVEDNPINLRVAQEILKGLSLRVEMARNGLEAVEILKRDRDLIHLVLMDIQMPELDGYGATERIRKELGFHDLPIIAMTAHALKEEKERCLEMGMDDHIPKPIERSVLEDVLKDYLGGEREDREEEEVSLQREAYQGIHREEALDRLAGDEELLEELLVLFVEEYSSFTSSFLDLLEKEEWGSLKKEVHALKGAAGNISALSIAESAKRVEELLEERDREEIRSSFATLKRELEIVLTSFTPEKKGEIDDSFREPQKEVKDVLTLLYNQLKRQSLDAEKTFFSLKRLLNGVIEDRSIEKLEDAIRRLDFSTALLALKELAIRLDHPIEEL